MLNYFKIQLQIKTRHPHTGCKQTHARTTAVDGFERHQSNRRLQPALVMPSSTARNSSHITNNKGTIIRWRYVNNSKYRHTGVGEVLRSCTWVKVEVCCHLVQSSFIIVHFFYLFLLRILLCYIFLFFFLCLCIHHLYQSKFIVCVGYKNHSDVNQLKNLIYSKQKTVCLVALNLILWSCPWTHQPDLRSSRPAEVNKLSWRGAAEQNWTNLNIALILQQQVSIQLHSESCIYYLRALFTS